MSEEGEICIDLARRPTGLMHEYLGDTDRNADAMRDGYYHTGDVASRDAEGYLTYVGRMDDVFKSSDYRISPFELESVLIEHAGGRRGRRGAEPRPPAPVGAQSVRGARRRCQPDADDRALHPRARARTRRRRSSASGAWSSHRCRRPFPARSAGLNCALQNSSAPQEPRAGRRSSGRRISPDSQPGASRDRPLRPPRQALHRTRRVAPERYGEVDERCAEGNADIKKKEAHKSPSLRIAG